MFLIATIIVSIVCFSGWIVAIADLLKEVWKEKREAKQRQAYGNEVINKALLNDGVAER